MTIMVIITEISLLFIILLLQITLKTFSLLLLRLLPSIHELIQRFLLCEDEGVRFMIPDGAERVAAGVPVEAVLVEVELESPESLLKLRPGHEFELSAGIGGNLPLELMDHSAVVLAVEIELLLSNRLFLFIQ